MVKNVCDDDGEDGGVGGDEGVHVNDTTTTSNVRLAYINPHVV